MGEKTFHVSVTSSSQGINVKPESGGQSINTTVSVTSQKNININAATKQNPIGATSDTGLYYSQLSKNWAIGEGLIQNEDYSSKTWAAESKSSADLSKMYSEAASLDYNNLSDTINQYNEQISGVVAEGINTIETTKTEASEYVETTANESIAEVNQAKEQAIKDFNKASDKVNYLFVMPIGHIGFSPFPIDESKGLQRLLNGQTIIQEQFTGFTKWLKEKVVLYPSVACTEQEWQTTVTMSINGTCDKFVIDDEAGTIRLPKYPEYCNKEYEIGKPTTTLSMGAVSIKGNGKSLGLTDGTNNFAMAQGTGGNNLWSYKSAYGSNVGTTTMGNNAGATNALSWGVTTDASKSGLTGSVSGTATTNLSVTETMQKGYWFIQLATGAEETVDVTREIELNNPFFFGYYQYFEVAPNNISWLKSEGQWNDKAVYTDYYDWILTNANNGVANFKLSTDTYDDYAWVVNTADETFRLPIKTKNAPFTVNGTANVDVYGNGKSLGLTNGTYTGALIGTGVDGLYTNDDAIGTAIGTSVSKANNWTAKTVGVVSDPSKSGLTGKATVSTSENTNVSLYFYVGETTQNANLINAGRIEEKLADIKAELPHKLKDTQITNCLLEVPQRIKLELADGVLTLKAGSVVTVPKGVGVFNEVEITSNRSITQKNDGRYFICAVANGSSIATRHFNSCESGATRTMTKTYSLWYDTTNNVLYNYTTDATTAAGTMSLPVAIVTVTNGAITSIDQVFNGIGYIGSTIWVDKGVKGLIPNGRNEDATLNNIEFTTSKVLKVTAQQNTQHIRLSANKLQIGGLIYDEVKNINTYNGEYRDLAIVGTVTGNSNNQITSLQPKQPFRAVDYNEFANRHCTTKATTTSSATSLNPAVIVQNYVSGTSWYRVWSDGWIEQGGSSAFSSKSTATITFAKKFASTPTINISGTFNEIAEIEVDALTTSNFTWRLNTSRTGTIYYYACGY